VHSHAPQCATSRAGILMQCRHMQLEGVRPIGTSSHHVMCESQLHPHLLLLQRLFLRPRCFSMCGAKKDS
jgi:hypothetical protein